jgi:hypothetical protein
VASPTVICIPDAVLPDSVELVSTAAPAGATSDESPDSPPGKDADSPNSEPASDTAAPSGETLPTPTCPRSDETTFTAMKEVQVSARSESEIVRCLGCHTVSLTVTDEGLNREDDR